MGIETQKAAEAPKPVYKYKVVERCFKEGMLLDPTKMATDDNPTGIWTSTELYNSRALVAADDATAKAVEQLKKDHAAFYQKDGPITSDEAADLRKQVAATQARSDALEQQLAEAIGALKQAAASAKK